MFHPWPTSWKRLMGVMAVMAALSGAMPLYAHAATASKIPSFTYTRIFYYREGKQAKESLFAHPSSINVLAPQTYALDASGELSGEVEEDVLVFAQKKKIKVMPLVTNGSFEQDAYKVLLDSSITQDSAIANLVAEAQKNGYWGWQIDFEQMDVSYRDKFSAFVEKTAAAMKKNNLIISVAVIAKISDNPNDYPKNIYQKTIGVYDYAAIATSTDLVSVMTYDDPNSKGPVAGYPWLKQVLDYSLKLIPPKKLSLGIPLYYWQWSDTTGKLVEIGGRKGINAVLEKHKVGVHYSVKQESPYLTYWSHAKPYTIWYENARSVKKKIDLIKKYKLHGFSAWALGLELPSIYESLK